MSESNLSNALHALSNACIQSGGAANLECEVEGHAVKVGIVHSGREVRVTLEFLRIAHPVVESVLSIATPCEQTAEAIRNVCRSAR